MGCTGERGTSVCPPSYGAMRLLDAMAASALRATAGWAFSASSHFLREIPEGGVGIPSAPVVTFANFLSVYIRHLNHPNPLVRRSTRHGLLTALWRFHPSQPCLTSELRLRCAAHPTDHDSFVTLCHQCDISIHLPPAEHLPDHAPHVMALSSPGLEVQDTHAWMLAGHHSAEDAHHGGWPRVSPRPTPPVSTLPPVGRSHAVTATVPSFSWLPENYGILRGAHGPGVVVGPWQCSAPSPSGTRCTLSPSPYGWTTPTRRSCTRRGWPSPPGAPRPTSPSGSGPAHGTLLIARGTSRPKKGDGN